MTSDTDAGQACPDCGSPLNDTDKDTAGLWCPQCRRYHWPPAELESRTYEDGFAAGRADENEACARLLEQHGVTWARREGNVTFGGLPAADLIRARRTETDHD